MTLVSNFLLFFSGACIKYPTAITACEKVLVSSYISHMHAHYLKGAEATYT